MNKEQGNKIIAEFDGYTWHPEDTLNGIKGVLKHPDKSSCYLDFTKPFHPKYHSSWDWLIPVCKKLESLPDTEKFNQKNYDKWVENSECLGNALWKLDIQLVWETVIQFIQWYTTQTKNIK